MLGRLIFLFSVTLIATIDISAQSFCDGFRAGFEAKVNETAYSLTVPACPVESPYCTNDKYSCGYVKGVETAINEIARFQSADKYQQPTYSPSSGSQTVFKVPDLGRIGYEIEAAKSPAQRQREAEARARARANREEYNKREKAKYISKSTGLKDITLGYNLPNSSLDEYYLFASIETFYHHKEKNYFVARINYIDTDVLPNLGLGYGWILSPYDYRDFEITIDAVGSFIFDGATTIPVENIRLSVFTNGFRNALGVNLNLTMMQRVRGGEFDFSAAPYFGLAYKRRFTL